MKLKIFIKTGILLSSGFLLMIYHELIYNGRPEFIIVQIAFISILVSVVFGLIYGAFSLLKKIDLVYLYIFFLSAILLSQIMIISIL
ncbi:hypothetical protein ERX46_05635 [Brumimicrobium glaciale]|uniref:Uncharacterized protein n=1 Tax=Brumimicrobium glaciale TaxID=200475 RepID=A0A4Q4KPR6_9FLAO|nr:hypothetical protein [Brumimicrobium glaciale]RYM34857.1 hypothetical protein ERX46_05635 [Brumimicrobium glaciale]